MVEVTGARACEPRNCPVRSDAYIESERSAMNRIVAAFAWVPVLALLAGGEQTASAQTQENGIVYEGPAPTQAQTVQPGTAQPVPQGTQQAMPQGPQPGAPPGVVPPPPSPQPAPPPSDAAQAQVAQSQSMNTENGWIW